MYILSINRRVMTNTDRFLNMFVDGNTICAMLEKSSDIIHLAHYESSKKAEDVLEMIFVAMEASENAYALPQIGRVEDD